MSVQTFDSSLAWSEFRNGARLGLPVVVAAAPFGLLFGAVAVDKGFTILEAVLMSATIYGGASQMVGLDLFGRHIAPWLIVFSIFAVNFRHVLYSAAIGRRLGDWSVSQKAVGFFFLVDPLFAEVERRSEEGIGFSFAWYMGVALSIYASWVVDALLGASFGKLLPDISQFGLDFLLSIYFLGLVMSFRSRPLWLPVVAISSVVSVIVYRTIGSPWHVSIGALAGIALAAILPSNGREKA